MKSVERYGWILEEKNVVLSTGKKCRRRSNRRRRPESVEKTSQILEENSGLICLINGGREEE